MHVLLHPRKFKYSFCRCQPHFWLTSKHLQFLPNSLRPFWHFIALAKACRIRKITCKTIEYWVRYGKSDFFNNFVNYCLKCFFLFSRLSDMVLPFKCMFYYSDPFRIDQETIVLVYASEVWLTSANEYLNFLGCNNTCMNIKIILGPVHEFSASNPI